MSLVSCVVTFILLLDSLFAQLLDQATSSLYVLLHSYVDLYAEKTYHTTLAAADIAAMVCNGTL